MMRRILAASVFTATLAGCTVPAATLQLLDTAVEGLDLAVTNSRQAHETITAGLDVQAKAARTAVESDLRGRADGDKVALEDALTLLDAYQAQLEAVHLARRRAEGDAREAVDNIEATRELVRDARVLVLYSQSITANVRRYVDTLTRKEPAGEQAE